MRCNAKELKKAITATARATTRDEDRPILTGILFEFTPGKLTLVGCDGFRLTRTTITCDTDLTTSVIVDAKQLKKWKPGNSEVEVLFNVDWMKLDNHEAKVIYGDYPDYTTIVRKHDNVVVLIDAAELKRAVKIAKPYAKETANFLLLRVRENMLIVQSRDPDAGCYIGRVDATTDGELTIGVNCQYLLDAIQGKRGEIILSLSAPTQPLTVENTIIMPMHLNGRRGIGIEKFDTDLAA